MATKPKVKKRKAKTKTKKSRVIKTNNPVVKIKVEDRDQNELIAPELKGKQAAFVEEFLVDLNATQAAIRAGYSKKTANQIGSENLAKLGIQLAIREGLKFRVKNAKVSKQQVVDGLVEIYERSMQAIEVRDMWGKPTGFWRFDSNGAIRALELIGKHLNMFSGEDPGGDGLRSGVIIIEIPNNGRNPKNTSARGVPSNGPKLTG